MSVGLDEGCSPSPLTYRTAFPPIDCARAHIRHCGEMIVHTRVADAERPRLVGPLSLFSNRRGQSLCHIDRRELALPLGAYALSAPDATFSLSYEQPVEVFNVHFSDALVRETMGALRCSDPLSEGRDEACVVLPVVRIQSSAIGHRLDMLHEAVTKGRSALDAAQLMVELLAAILSADESMRRAESQLAPVKRSTRRDLFVRVHRAIDYMHAFHPESVHLGQLAKVSCISRYHFLRCFKALTGLTPQRYLTEIRLQRARQLLRATSDPLHVIATRVGFSEASSLSRAFARRFGASPARVRS